jgi:hypothetical protein
MRRWLPSWFPRRSSQAVPSSSQPRRRNRSSLRPRRRLRPRRLRLHYPAANGANRRGPVRCKNPGLASPTQYLTAIERASRRPSNRRAGPKCSHYVPQRRLRRFATVRPECIGRRNWPGRVGDLQERAQTLRGRRDWAAGIA